MSKYKYLILLLIILTSLYYSEAPAETSEAPAETSEAPAETSETPETSGSRTLSSLLVGMHTPSNPRVYETFSDYEKRLADDEEYEAMGAAYFNQIKSNIPTIGEIYNEYFQDRKIIYNIVGYTEIEFKEILESYPKLTENKAEFLKRIDFTSLGLNESNSTEYYIGLYSLLPIFAETYNEYSIRIKSKGLVPMKQESFILYQAYYPNLCVQYIEFSYTINVFERTNPRFIELNLQLYPEKKYNDLKIKFPIPFESEVHFNNRMREDDENLHLIYERFFAKRMYPRMSETYDEYCNRIDSIFFPEETAAFSANYLKPISYDLFEEYKKNYPQLQIYYEDLGFENKDDWVDYEDIQPVMDQINEVINLHYTGDDKPIDYDAIFDLLIEKNSNYIRQKNVLEITMDETAFRLLMKRLPNVYENYPIYKQRMFMIATNLLDEEEFNDLKQIYTKQCETYDDYKTRMKQICIYPTTLEVVGKVKMVVPREFGDHNRYYQLLNSETHHQEKRSVIVGYKTYKRLPFFLDNLREATPPNDDPDEPGQKVYIDEAKQLETIVYNEQMRGYHYIKALTLVSFRAIKYVLPIPFEKYGKYKRRITKFRRSYEFSDYREMRNQNRYQKAIFKSFLQPLTKDEFLDLKLRFPKLSETVKNYEDRIQISYGLDLFIDDNKYFQFHLIKHSQIQLYDTYFCYKNRFNQLMINKSSLLEDYNISLATEAEFNLFKQYLPIRPYVYDYLTYTNDMKNDYENMLDVNDYDDFMKVFPRFYDTLTEYIEVMEKRYLDPVTYDYFLLFKKVHPQFSEADFEDYTSRISTYRLELFDHGISEIKVTKFGFSQITEFSEFNKCIDSFPRPFEPFKTYRIRFPNVSKKFYKSGDFDRSKLIYPKVSSIKEEYIELMNSMNIPIDPSSFRLYKHHLPKVSDNTITYEEYLTNLNANQTFMMTAEEYHLWFLRLPKTPERYSSYKERIIQLQQIDEIDEITVEPLEKHEFHDLKHLFPFPYESYSDHFFRLESYSLRAITEDQFNIEKTYQVLVGESYDSHVERILKLFNYSINDDDIDSIKKKIVNDHGIESLIPENFAEHALSYPFNYDTLETFIWRQDKIKSDLEPDPQIKNKRWYPIMKSLLPRMNEKIETFRETVATYNLSFPEITEIQFNRHLYSLPHPAESYTTFESRTNYVIPDHTQPSEDTTSPADPTSSERPTVITMCPIINSFLNEQKFKKMLYDIFIALSPNFLIDHLTYFRNGKENAPLTEKDFSVCQKCLPKQQDSILEHNKKITEMGLTEITKESFIKLKIFYPRIYHFTYDNYVLDIELKYGKEANGSRGVIDALKLSIYEFTEYKNKFPKLFEFSYVTYWKQMERKGIRKVFTRDEFKEFRKANFPLPAETYEQHKSKMDSLDIDPIPYDLFCYFKTIYPDLYELKYTYRVAKGYTELQRVNYNDDKYKSNMENQIVSAIIARTNPYQELEEKFSELLEHSMDSKKFSNFKKDFPEVFKSYPQFVRNYNRSYGVSSGYSNVMDEEVFKSFKKAYFISIDETYEEYKTRMKSLKLTAIPSNLFRYYKSTYPHLANKYESYGTLTKLCESVELRNVGLTMKNKIQSSGYKILSADDYSIFQKNFPRIFDSPTNYFKAYAADLLPIIFNHDEFDSIKIAYYPRLSESHGSYKARMISLGLGVMNYESFKSFKAAYPNPMTASDYSKYKSAFEETDKHENSIGIRNIMTEEEFSKDLKEDFPKLFESWEEFYDRRQISNSENKIDRLINDDGIFSKNLFNDMKIVYHPIFGRDGRSFSTFNRSLGLPVNTESWMNYYTKVIKLYPIFFEIFENYEDRLKGEEFEHLKLNGREKFYEFFKMFPFPYETYSQYKKRNAAYQCVEDATYKLTELEFIYFRRVFPAIFETYDAYKSRLETKLHIVPVGKNMFLLFKLLFPQIDEPYDTYKKRFDKSLIDSDEETKQQLSFLVQYMGFRALDYTTYEGTDITSGTTGGMDIAESSSGSTDIAAETSGAATHIKTNGAMTYEEFEVLKLSLPVPNELREDYKIRINKLVSFAKLDDTAKHVEPDILPSDLFQDLLNCYPKVSENYNYDTYSKEMGNINSIPMSKNTFDELITVSTLMTANPFTFDKISFYKTIVASKNQESHPSWPWYVDTILARREMKKENLVK